MVTSPATPAPPWSQFGLAALEAAAATLPDVGHPKLVLRSIAKAAGGTHPAILKQFGSQLGFMAALAACQWDRLNAELEGTRTDALTVAMIGITFAVDHPAEFRLMYDHEIWTRATAPDQDGPPREQVALQLLEAARDRNFEILQAAFPPDHDPLTLRLVAALLTGLSFEFANERLYQGHRQKQLAHAKELLGMALGRGAKAQYQRKQR